MKKFPFWRIVRILLAIAIVAFLVTHFDMRQTAGALLHASWAWILLSVLLGYGTMFFQSLRWRELMLVHAQSPKPLLPYLESTATGNAANMVLPSTIGGDVVRCVSFGKSTGLMTESVSSVLVGRVIGVLLLPPMTLFAFAFVDMRASMRTGILSVMALATLGGLGFFVFCLIGRNARHLKGSGRFSQTANKFFEVLHNYRHEPRRMLASALYSLPVQVFAILQGLLSYWAIGADMPASVAFFAFPALILAGMIPVTIGNVGVKESLSIMVFTAAHLSAEQCIAANVIGYLIVFTQALPGLLVLLFRKGEKNVSRK